MKRLLSTTTLATALAVGAYGLAGAQAVNPGQPGSASGGIMAQQGQPGTQSGAMTQPGSGQHMGSNTGSPSGQTGSTAPSTMGQSGGSTAQAGQASRMSEEQVRTALRGRGYSDIEGLERDGDNFKIREAKRFGEEVKDLRVDARTGQVRDEGRLSEDQAKNLLRDRGYRDVSDVSRDGDIIRAKAKQGDREVRLRIDARTGTVTQQQASN